jgi:hypothetical protein
MRKRIKWATALMGVTALIAASVALLGKPSGNSIWVVPLGGSSPTARAATSMRYGSSFAAGYTSKAPVPYGHLVCTANSTTQLASGGGGVVMDAYRAVQADGSIGVFTLNDPLNQQLVGGGADCTLSLVAFQGGQMKTLATTGFTATS